MGTTTKPTSRYGYGYGYGYIMAIPLPIPTDTHTHDPRGYAVPTQMPRSHSTRMNKAGKSEGAELVGASMPRS